MAKAGGKNREKAKKMEKETLMKSKRDDRITRKELRKQEARERNYESNDEREFLVHLNAIGCKIKYIAGDGNCMFRSIADQIDGDPNNHGEYRARIMNYIQLHQEHFSLFFIEDDESFDDYVARMRRDREWGGHPELYAASQLLNVEIVVHQHNTPRFLLQSTHPIKRIHLSYHGEFHYNSVRSTDDVMDGIPAPITLRDAPLPSGPTSSTSTPRDRSSDAYDLVRASVPWADDVTVRMALEMTSGDAPDAIELLLANPDGFDDVARAMKAEDMASQAEEEERAGMEAVALAIASEIAENETKNAKGSKSRSNASNSRGKETKYTHNAKVKASSSRQVEPAPAEEKALSKKEKRMLRQGKNKPVVVEHPTTAVKAGEVSI